MPLYNPQEVTLTNTANLTNKTLTSAVLATSAIFSFLAIGQIPYIGANGTILGDTSKMVIDAATGRVCLGNATPLAARLTIYGDGTTDDIMYWIGSGGGSVLMSKNGFSPTNLGGSFHVNMGGTTTHFAIQEDEGAGARTGASAFKIEGLVASRTVPVAIVRGGPTPAAGAHLLDLRQSDETVLSYFDKDGKFVYAGATALGGVNVKQSGSGYYIVVNDTTHYSNNELNAALSYSYKVDSNIYNSRMLAAQGSDATAANNLSLSTGQTTSGNTYCVTGNTQINLLASTGWQNGAQVTLLFTGTPTVKHNQATSGANTKILLAGAADFVASANDMLTLCLCTDGTTVAWREVSRSVI